jgi:hypothetical protein
MTTTEKIKELQSQLTGDLMNDCGTHNEIYKLKIELAKEQGITIEQYEDDNREECEACGS